jgi:4-methyl-5(b-hydroxyethyl)-thiazole monophosphate biosynthesis
MKKVALLLANGFEEIEAISLIDVLRRGGIDVNIVGVGGSKLVGANSVVIEANSLIEDLNSTDLDLVLLPGGMPGAKNLAENEMVQNLLKEMDKKEKLIGAICAAPFALHKAGVLKDNYTAYPSWEEKIKKDGYIDNQMVVKDKNILTSRGPATAICFGISILRELVGDEVAKSVKAGLLASYCEDL